MPDSAAPETEADTARRPLPAGHIRAGGAPEGFDARLVLRELERGKPVVHVARDDKRAEAMAAALRFHAPGTTLLRLPAWDCLPYDRVSPAAEISAARMSTLTALAHGLSGKFVLLTTLAAATQRIPSRKTLKGAGFAAHVDQQIDEAALRDFLVRMGFTQTPTVMEPGDWSPRGGIIDIWPPGQPAPVRLDLFGDVLDGLRRFDPATQRTTEQLKAIELAPVSEVILDGPAITRFRQTYRIEFGAAGTDDPLYEAVTAGRKAQGIEHWLSFFQADLETLPDLLPDASWVMDDATPAHHAERWTQITDMYDNRREAMTAKGRVDSVYKPAPPDGLYLSPDAFDAVLADKRVLHLSPFAAAPGPGVIDAGGRVGRSFAPERQRDDVNLFEVLADHIAEKRAEGAVVIASYSGGARERLQGLLEDQDVAGAKPIRAAADVAKGELGLAIWPLDRGFEGPAGDTRLTVISEQDVLGERLIRGKKKKRRAENFLTEAQTLSVGDLVVHVDHGVGRFTGFETVTAAGAPHECLALEYAGGDRLFLPVENIELLSRYGSEEGLLDKLGGGAWQARKARLRERIRQIAERLMRIAAERALRKAPILEAPHDMWEGFAARFPYEETDDQLQAIEDVATDLASGTPMDRLIVGDVGFGKTEVAMRAAFIAATSGKQVAVIAPTTLLARQHAKSFQDRFRGQPITVRQLSRFVSAKEAAETRRGIAEGTVDIAIGTHALLAKQVRFHDLGLLVIDEEQHFGVTHKERLKEMRSDVHVLTLSATPIPRTLQMSLTGVRDLSVIQTPPVDRLAIRTYVSEFDAVTVREALLREHYRGGQSFVVVPRISDLSEMEAFLREQLPELSYVIAHGQLAAGDLDERMNAFYDGRYDVLLSTTIIESGIDIPTANTMVIWRADMFGLAQLYQIRGRVGRSKARAYAYLTTKPKAKLTPQAERRLKALGSIDALGAGFNIASQDLDLRGGGNIVGEEQSGHVKEVGFELYQSMLEETIAKLKAGDAGLADALSDDWSPQIALGVPVLIPEEYVVDLDVRLGLYRRLSGLEKKVELEGFAAELIDRFGPLPREVNVLMRIVRIKAMCKAAGIEKLTVGQKGATVEFHQGKFANPAGLVEFIQGWKGAAQIKGDKIVIRAEAKTEAERIKGAFSIAKDLAVAARAKS
ncbi:transcription-repair coupling factor [Jannaschia seohaensis]|uniref:Transcription-repair-coupling factor n=1 Tax=Jannaschia seohaensis TaxID=475081 RepID=A0A2Y9C8S4_9RHOB|nr:transcription-repair coupling factor [Jannaschia seohaensis]PWJ14391.1 transcription-repair coupling factor (superfamily II helicase) [Jannaschia seohaensis]SSA50103.1 transcription-repair coupling factor (superfamily II helicase) [Jannaschia seohaensis]